MTPTTHTSYPRPSPSVADVYDYLPGVAITLIPYSNWESTLEVFSVIGGRYLRLDEGDPCLGSKVPGRCGWRNKGDPGGCRWRRTRRVRITGGRPPHRRPSSTTRPQRSLDPGEPRPRPRRSWNDTPEVQGRGETLDEKGSRVPLYGV